MRTRNFIFIFFVIGIKTFAQDNKWKKVTLSNLLSLSIPATSIKIDTFLIKNSIKQTIIGYRAETQNGIYAVAEYENPVYIQITDKSKKNEFVMTSKFGFEKRANEKGLEVIFLDTSIGEILGFKAEVYSQKQLTYIDYNFFAENKCYSFILSPANNDSAYKDFSKLLGSIHFNKNRKKSETDLKKGASTIFNNPYKLGQALGSLLFSLLIVGVIAGVIMYSSKKKKLKQNT
jgi:hypothetical protein